MRFLTPLAIFSLTIPMSACVHNTKMLTADAQCRLLITQAQKLYTAQSQHSRTTRQAANLITAAKISEEKHEFIICIDKADRARELLDPNSILTLQPSPSPSQH